MSSGRSISSLFLFLFSSRPVFIWAALFTIHCFTATRHHDLVCSNQSQPAVVVVISSPLSWFIVYLFSPLSSLRIFAETLFLTVSLEKNTHKDTLQLPRWRKSVQCKKYAYDTAVNFCCCCLLRLLFTFFTYYITVVELYLYCNERNSGLREWVRVGVG